MFNLKEPIMIIDGVEYLTTQEAAARLEITEGRVRQLISDKLINSRKLGNSNLIPRTEVERYNVERGRAGWQKGRPRKVGGNS